MSAASTKPASAGTPPDAGQYATTIESFIPILTVHEGWIPYMYLDSQGSLTIGVGHLVVHAPGKGYPHWTKPSVTSAVQDLFQYGFESSFLHLTGLGLTSTTLSGIVPGPKPGLAELQMDRFLKGGCMCQVIEDNQKPGVWGGAEMFPGARQAPTVEAISEDAVNILGMNYQFQDPKKKKGDLSAYAASHYQRQNRFVLSDDGIHALAFDDIFSKIPAVKAVWPKFGSFPQPAQLALLDIAFQGFPVTMKAGSKATDAQKAFDNGTGPAKTAFAAALAETPPNFKKAASLVPQLSTSWYAGVKSDRTSWRENQLLAAARTQSAGSAPQPAKIPQPN
jgi:hypothetical protein